MKKNKERGKRRSGLVGKTGNTQARLGPFNGKRFTRVGMEPEKAKKFEHGHGGPPGEVEERGNAGGNKARKNQPKVNQDHSSPGVEVRSRGGKEGETERGCKRVFYGK